MTRFWLRSSSSEARFRAAFIFLGASALLQEFCTTDDQDLSSLFTVVWTEVNSIFYVLKWGIPWNFCYSIVAAFNRNVSKCSFNNTFVDQCIQKEFIHILWFQVNQPEENVFFSISQYLFLWIHIAEPMVLKELCSDLKLYNLSQCKGGLKRVGKKSWKKEL